MASTADLNSEFFVTLQSNACKYAFPDNKPHKFKIKLPEPLSVKQDEWAVGLSQISYFSGLYLFPSGYSECRKVILELLDSKNVVTTEVTFCFKENPTNIQETTTALNKVIEEINENSLKNIDWYFEIVLYADIFVASFTLEKSDSPYAKRKIRIRFPDPILKVLGWAEGHCFENNSLNDHANFPYDWSKLSTHMLILSDISKNQIISDRKAPLLRTIGIRAGGQDHRKGGHSICVNQIFQNIYFSDIINEFISTIQIEIVDEKFNYINFIENNISIVLCFRKKF